MGGDPAAAERACRPTSNGQPVIFLGKKRRASPTRFGGRKPHVCAAQDVGRARPQRPAPKCSLCTLCCCPLFCSSLLPPLLVARQGGDWCCLQDVFGGAWDFCAAKFGSDVRNRDKVCVLVRVASICSNRLHSAPLLPRAGRVCVLACSSPACRVGHPCPSDSHLISASVCVGVCWCVWWCLCVYMVSCVTWGTGAHSARLS